MKIRNDAAREQLGFKEPDEPRPAPRPTLVKGASTEAPRAWTPGGPPAFHTDRQAGRPLSRKCLT